MPRFKTGTWLVVAVLTAAVVAGVAFAQQGGPGGGRAAQGAARFGRGQGGQFDAAAMRRMISERMRNILGASEEEWTILGPRVEKVQNLMREVRGSRMAAMFRRSGPGGRGGQPGGTPAQPAAEVSPVQKATDELEATLADEAAGSDVIRQKLTALRAAREKAQQQLDAARKELREVVTLRQEAQLVLMGLLD